MCQRNGSRNDRVNPVTGGSYEPLRASQGHHSSPDRGEKPKPGKSCRKIGGSERSESGSDNELKQILEMFGPLVGKTNISIDKSIFDIR